MIEERIAKFDQERAQALRRIWFVGDVHGYFRHLARTLEQAAQRPAWVVFAGDIDINVPFGELLAPIRSIDESVRFAFVHGNHDADSYERWEALHDPDGAVALHGQVVNLAGVLVAGLGGHFVGRVWVPPAEPVFASKKAALNRGAFQYRGGQRLSPVYQAAIYQDELERLAKKRADILITHEAPSCHPHGFEALDGLARSLRAVRAFHGHHHDDRTAEYRAHRERLGFDTVGLRFCQIKNGLGEEIFEGERNW